MISGLLSTIADELFLLALLFHFGKLNQLLKYDDDGGFNCS